MKQSGRFLPLPLFLTAHASLPGTLFAIPVASGWRLRPAGVSNPQLPLDQSTYLGVECSIGQKYFPLCTESPSRREVSLSNILFYSSSSPYNMIIPKKTKTFVILEDIPDCNKNQNFTFNCEGLILHRGALRSWTRDPNKTVASRRLCFVKTSGLWPHWQIEKLKSLQLDWCGCPPQQWHGSSYSYLKLKYSTIRNMMRSTNNEGASQKRKIGSSGSFPASGNRLRRWRRFGCPTICWITTHAAKARPD